MSLVSVKFLKGYQPFCTGEIAGVPDHVAEKLVSKKIAELVPVKKAKKSTKKTEGDSGEDSESPEKPESEDEKPEGKPKTNTAKTTK